MTPTDKTSRKSTPKEHSLLLELLLRLLMGKMQPLCTLEQLRPTLQVQGSRLCADAGAAQNIVCAGAGVGGAGYPQRLSRPDGQLRPARVACGCEWVEPGALQVCLHPS